MRSFRKDSSFRSILSTCSGINRKVVGFPAESLDGMLRNQWSTCSGMTGRLGPEYAEKMRNKVEASNALLKQAQATHYQIEQSKKGIEAASAAVQTTEKALEIARVTLGYTKVRSPLEGVIAKKFVDPGDFISPGAPAFTVYNKQNIYITANLEETKIARVKVGQEVDVKVDAYKKTLKGKVIKIGEASGAKFALIPRDTSAGEFTKVVQRLPVKIMVINNPDYPLKPGLSVSAAIKVK